MRGFSAVSACSTASATSLGRRAAAASLHGELAERIDAHAVERPRLRRRIRALARPDRRLDRPRLDDRHVDAPRRELDAQRVGHRLERELRHRVRTEQRQRVQPGDRAHVDDAAARRAQRRQAELRHPQLPDDVHLELAAQLVRRQELERPGNRDARVVDQPVAARRAPAPADPSRRRAPPPCLRARCLRGARPRARASPGRAAAPRTPPRCRTTRP